MIQPCEDTRFMAAALALGRRGLGLCAPNPAVGALVVKDGVIVARGWTRPGGRPHAETEALREAGAQARGATFYVTLEPCSHHGQTPPCTDAIIAAGAGRVVVTEGKVGGGSQPLRVLPSSGVAVPGDPRPLLAELRRGTPAVIAIVRERQVTFDVRCVSDVAQLAEAAASAIHRATERAVELEGATLEEEGTEG